MRVRDILGVSCLCGLIAAVPICAKYIGCTTNIQKQQGIDAEVTQIKEMGQWDYSVELKAASGIYHARFAFHSDYLGEKISSDERQKVYLSELKLSLAPGTRVKLDPEYFDGNHIGIFDGQYAGLRILHEDSSSKIQE